MGAGALGLVVAVGLSGCAVPLRESCPRCLRLVVGERPPVALGTRTVFVLVPGLLGYGWEWNGVQIAFAALPDAVVLVDEWDPWTSVYEGGAQLASRVQYLLQRLPRSVRRVVLISHSAGGLLAVVAASHLRVPAGLGVEVVVVGAPLAGSRFDPLVGPDNFYSLLPVALGGTFTHWPEPAPGVALTIWPTGGHDPVMQVRFGHDPGDRRVWPRAATLQPLPPELDHNVALSLVARQLVARLRPPSPPPLVVPAIPAAERVPAPPLPLNEPAAERTSAPVPPLRLSGPAEERASPPLPPLRLQGPAEPQREHAPLPPLRLQGPKSAPAEKSVRTPIPPLRP